jgi:hypothetical protein
MISGNPVLDDTSTASTPASAEALEALGKRNQIALVRNTDKRAPDFKH